MPLRPLVGAPDAAMIAEMEGGLRRLWAGVLAGVSLESLLTKQWQEYHSQFPG